ncbi:MAG: hypothetical protein R3A13_10190 [Bdellovibrionota bacterium]
MQEIAPNQASDSSFDKRLPPTLPGEIMNDSGRKMKDMGSDICKWLKSNSN